MACGKNLINRKLNKNENLNYGIYEIVAKMNFIKHIYHAFLIITQI